MMTLSNWLPDSAIDPCHGRDAQGPGCPTVAVRKARDSLLPQTFPAVSRCNGVTSLS